MRKGKTTTRSRGTRRKESARVDTDPLPKGLAGFGRARARVLADVNGIGFAQRCLPTISTLHSPSVAIVIDEFLVKRGYRDLGN
jgi:hypothetical protein